MGTTYFIEFILWLHLCRTCYLAGKLARHLKKIHPDKVDDRDVLCVELAALCHDLGEYTECRFVETIIWPCYN